MHLSPVLRPGLKPQPPLCGSSLARSTDFRSSTFVCQLLTSKISGPVHCGQSKRSRAVLSFRSLTSSVIAILIPHRLHLPKYGLYRLPEALRWLNGQTGPLHSRDQSSSSWNLRPWVVASLLLHGVNLYRLDLIQHALLAGLGKRIFVLPQILLCHLVDVSRSAVLRNLRHLAADFHVAVWVVGVH
jgi:hypothetical protein